MLVVLALLVVVVVGFGATYLIGDPRRAEAVEASTVVLADSGFEAPVIRVAPGTEVTWQWVGRQAHDVSGDGWGSSAMAGGEWSHTFDRAGTHDYVCSLHPLTMRGRVVVQAEAIS